MRWQSFAKNGIEYEWLSQHDSEDEAHQELNHYLSTSPGKVGAVRKTGKVWTAYVGTDPAASESSKAERAAAAARQSKETDAHFATYERKRARAQQSKIKSTHRQLIDANNFLGALSVHDSRYDLYQAAYHAQEAIKRMEAAFPHLGRTFASNPSRICRGCSGTIDGENTRGRCSACGTMN